MEYLRAQNLSFHHCGLSDESRRRVRLEKLETSNKMEKFCHAFECVGNSKNKVPSSPPKWAWFIKDEKTEETCLEFLEKQA